MVLEKNEVFRIEVMSMSEGLHLLWNNRYRQVELECDNAFLVKIILAG
ncbi:hypothetical protein Gogos_016680 [Gossypium gossypioides]|uniref:RNase H type-1 domain-containing protein n=1 Tax=Gossypium gossypioides TaxID=34282 RepID=A0A7J9BAH1_GOSGO|nr:hypothetical protein [Gossypium gossypioides]